MDNILRKAREAREFLTPVLKTSKFLGEGVLTPEEFVKAGEPELDRYTRVFLVGLLVSWKKKHVPACRKRSLHSGPSKFVGANTTVVAANTTILISFLLVWSASCLVSQVTTSRSSAQLGDGRAAILLIESLIFLQTSNICVRGECLAEPASV